MHAWFMHMDSIGVQADKIIHFTTDAHECRYGRIAPVSPGGLWVTILQ